MKREERGICVKQPWAWFIVNGYKDIENRNNPPPDSRIGEKVLIVASKRKLTKREYEDFVYNCGLLKIKRYPKSVDEFDYGAIVGSAVIMGYSYKAKSKWAAKGACHWKLERAKKVKAIPQKGQQTLFFKISI